MISAEAVEKVFFDCLYTDDELLSLVNVEAGEFPSGAVIVEGVMYKFGFHPTRLEANREKVRAFLGELRPEFHAKTGGGWTFLNLCVDKKNRQWGEHLNCEQLMSLGFGLKMGKYLSQRSDWAALPGGMPYVCFDTTGVYENQV